MILKTMTSTSIKVSRLVVLVLVLAASVCTLPILAHAQNAVSYTVSPTIYDMTANPGQVFKSTVRIINTNSFELKVYIDVNSSSPKKKKVYRSLYQSIKVPRSKARLPSGLPPTKS